MSKLTKLVLGIIVLVLLVTGAWFSQKGASAPLVDGPIKIGFIGPLSGDGASYGITEKNAVQMAVDEINAAGGVRGQKLVVVYEDGLGTGAGATNAATKLVNIDKVKVILGGAFSSETLTAAPITERARVILFSAFSSNPQITNAGDYVFRNSPSDSDIAKLDANIMVSKHYKKIAIISEDSDYPQGVRKIMNQIFTNNNVQVVANELFGGAGTSVSDFRTNLIKIKEAKPDALYINPALSGKSGGLIVKQARQLGINVPIYGNLSLIGPDAITAGGKLMDGVIVSDSTGLSDRGQLILAKYKQLFGTDPANLYEMGASYDRVYIIKNAIASVGYDSTKIKNYLYNLSSYSGTIGTYHFDQNGDIVGVGFTNYIIKDGKEAPLQ